MPRTGLAYRRQQKIPKYWELPLILGFAKMDGRQDQFKIGMPWIAVIEKKAAD